MQDRRYQRQHRHQQRHQQHQQHQHHQHPVTRCLPNHHFLTFTSQPSPFALNMFRSSLLRNVACMANDEFQQLSDLQPVARLMALLQIPIKLLCAHTDPWVPEHYIQQYNAAARFLHYLFVTLWPGTGRHAPRQHAPSLCRRTSLTASCCARQRCVFVTNLSLDEQSALHQSHQVHRVARHVGASIRCMRP